MAKRRGTPDQRGMGAPSDLIAQQLLPDQQYRAQQLARAHTLLALGIAPEQVAAMLSLPLEALSIPKPASE